MNFLNIFRKTNWKIRDWNEKQAKDFITSNQDKLVINRSLKWKGTNNYSFLLDIKESLRDLEIIDFSEKVDISALEYLSLEKLVLETGVKCRWPVSWPDSLKDVKINITSKTPDLAILPLLETITIWGSCNWPQLPTFNSPNLWFVSVDSSKLKRLFTEYHKRVTSLEISGCKDLCLDGLKFCPNLENLELLDIGGKLDISHISQLCKLKRLVIDGDSLQVDSLVPLCEINTLTWIGLGNTRVNDGKMSVLGRLPNLEKIAFNDKKGNDISLSEFITTFQCEHI
jgi:hypothetical protein